jgi:hypothetical protein
MIEMHFFITYYVSIDAIMAIKVNIIMFKLEICDDVKKRLCIQYFLDNMLYQYYK